MADTPPPPAMDPSKQAAAPDPASVEELAKAVSAMNRFLSKFAGLKAFAEARLTVADWTVLMYLLDTKEPRFPFAASFTGISDQRIVRIIDALVAADLILSTESPDPARPNPILSVTDLGKARLDALNSALRPLLAKATEANANAIPAIKRNVPYLMRMVTG